MSTIKSVFIPSDVNPTAVFGPGDDVLRVIESELRDLEIVGRADQLLLRGSESSVRLAAQLLEELVLMARHSRPVDASTVAQSLRLLASDMGEAIVGRAGKRIFAKTPGQEQYLESIANNRITFGIGPAGTGKTYLAMARAVQALLAGDVRRIVLTRPAVEAGENLGFLPGSLSEKIDPYLRPLYDALRDMLEPAEVTQLLENGTIEVAPLAYMRGRTLSGCFVVLDEAQNTTEEQMKMCLTRLGQGTTMVITGDVTQIDLPRGKGSGLTQAERVLQGIAGIGFSYLSAADVVRDSLVSEIISAYEGN